MSDYSGQTELEIRMSNLPDSQKNLSQTEESISISEETKEALESFSKKFQLSHETVFVCAWAILLAKYSSKEDVVFGSLLEVFSFEALPIRICLNPESTITEALKNMQKQLTDSQRNQCSLDEIKNDIGYSNKIPFYNHLFCVQNSSNPTPRSLNEFSLSLVVFESESTTVKCFFDNNQYSEDSIKYLLGHYQKLLQSLIASPEKKILEVSMLTEGEKYKIHEWNNTDVEFPKDKTIHQLFEEQVERTPEDIALLYDNRPLTYRELNKKANQLARHLLNCGVKTETLVAISMERSLELIIGIFGILKSGAAYVPLDPTFPNERLDLILKDSKTPILITSSNLKDKFIHYSGKFILMDLDQKEIDKNSSENMSALSRSENLAYVIYTSGSTGKPKGVLIEHKSVINILCFLQKKYPLNEADAYLLKTNITFDVSVPELFGWIFAGGMLILLKQGEEKEPDTILNTIEKYKITHINFVPTILQFLIDFVFDEELKEKLSPKYIFSVGEAVSKKLVTYMQNFLKNQTRFENMYGPTETTVFSTTYNLNTKFSSANSPIGKPLANTKVYILDKNLKLVPIGLPGELYIGGVGLARGYLNLSELTAKMFIQSPFSSNPTERIYKTGDLCRYLPDGNIEYLGRIDFQVKIRGHRIELAEIEACLTTHPRVKEVVVTALVKNSENLLVAYCKGHDPNTNDINIDELRHYLKTLLPDYMIPSAFVVMDSFPVNSNGKLNRNALPEPTIGGEFVPPSSPLEKKIASIWAEVLKIERVSVNDNFFGLGGHSLYAARIAVKIRNLLGKEVTLSDFNKAQTLRDLSSLIINKESIVKRAEIRARTSKEMPLSYSSLAYWLAETVFGSFNIVQRRCFYGGLDITALTFAFECLFKRHPILCSYASSFNGILHLQNNFKFRIEEKDIRHLSEEDTENELYSSFQNLYKIRNWKKGFTMLQARIFYLKNDCSELQISVSHTVADAISAHTILSELSNFYGDYKNKIPVNVEIEEFQREDFIAAERNDVNQNLNKYTDFWENYGQDTNFFSFPGDVLLELKKEDQFSPFAIEIPENDVKKIDDFCRLNSLNRGYFLCAVSGIVISKYSIGSNKNILTLILSSFRGTKIPESTVGCFIHANHIKLDINDNSNPIDLTKDINKKLEETEFYQRFPAVAKEAFTNAHKRFSESTRFKKFLAKMILFFARIVFTKQKFNQKSIGYIIKNSIFSGPKKNEFVFGDLNIQPDFFDKGFEEKLFGLDPKHSDWFFSHVRPWPGRLYLGFYKDIPTRKYYLYIIANLTIAFREKIGKDFLNFIRKL